jgi:UDP-N-acetylmuramate dehydrogenase
MSLGALERSLRARLRGRVEAERPLAGLTTYRLGGPARLYVEPADPADIDALGDTLRDAPGVPLLVLGRGSNVVVSDGGWPGIALRLGPAFAWIEPLEVADAPGGLRAGAGTPLPTLANWAARRGLSGLEFLVAIPGSVGGAVRMNAGAHGGAVADTLCGARVADLARAAIAARAAGDLDLGYRRSNLASHDVVLDATFALRADDGSAIRARMDEYRRHRAATQPGALQNAGSVFRNPPGDAAGRLVEAAGLKGWRVGGACVADLHANFFIADPGAAAQDVFDLVEGVAERVRSLFGVELEPEIRFAGAFARSGRPLEPSGR